MANTTKTKREHALMAKARLKKVLKAIKHIKQFHERGRKTLDAMPKEGTYGKKFIEHRARRLRTNEDTLRKACQFAAECDEDELEELIAELRAKQSTMHPKRPVFSVSHISRLLGVRRKKKRKELQEKAIAKGWSRAQLVAAIRKTIGRRTGVGRRPYVPKKEMDANNQIEGLCAQWLRWDEELQRGDPDRKHILLRDLDEPVQALLANARKVLRELHEAVVARVKAIQRRMQREQAATRQALARK